MAAFRHVVLLENIRLRSKVRNYDKKDGVNNIIFNIGTPKIVAHLKISTLFQKNTSVEK